MDFQRRFKSSVDKIICANISFSSRMRFYIFELMKQRNFRYEFSVEIMQLSKMKVIYSVKGFLS